jgi:hypothetical protein
VQLKAGEDVVFPGLHARGNLEGELFLAIALGG